MKWDYLISGAIVGVLLFLLAMLCDTFTFTDRLHEPATVVALTYKPTETQTGTAIDSRGRPYTTVTTSSEEWTVVCKTDAGEIVAMKAANGQDWGRIHDSGKAVVVTRSSRIFGFTRREVRPRNN